jgi:hypothetical protein
MKKLTNLRQELNEATYQLDKQTLEIKELKNQANSALDQYEIETLNSLNIEYLVRKSAYLNWTEKKSRVEDSISALFELKVKKEIDYEFFVKELKIPTDNDCLTLKGNQVVRQRVIKVLCMKTVPLCSAEIKILGNLHPNPNIELVIEEVEENQLWLRFRHFNYLRQEYFDMNFHEVNQKMSWLTGLNTRDNMIREYNLSIFTDNLISA